MRGWEPRLRTLFLIQLGLFAGLMIALPYFGSWHAFAIAVFFYLLTAIALGSYGREAWQRFESDRRERHLRKAK